MLLPYTPLITHGNDRLNIKFSPINLLYFADATLKFIPSQDKYFSYAIC